MCFFSLVPYYLFTLPNVTLSPQCHTNAHPPHSSDLWTLGCIVYQMIAGRFAFHGPSEYLTWQKIKKLEYTFPEAFDEDAKDFIQRLFVSPTFH